MRKWQEMTKEELETQYSPSRWSPRLDKDVVIEEHTKAVTEGTQKAQAFTQTLLNVPYGSAFPLVLYIHGGYWQCLSKDVSGFAACPLVNQGIALAAVGYDVAPKGQLEMMVEQVRHSVAFAVQQYTGISCVYLLGHSAGAHLAAMVLSTDWAEFGVQPNIKGVFLVSGIYDLEPIMHTYINDPLHLSLTVAQENSPLLRVPKVKDEVACQVLIAVAQHDPPEFHRQSRKYCQALRTAGWKVSLLDLAGTDHFDVIEKLSQENYLLTQMAEAGFIHCPIENASDVAQCFICFKELEGWEPDDDPMEEHRKHSPKCAFLSLKKDICDLTIQEFMKLRKERMNNLIETEVKHTIIKMEKYANLIREKIDDLRSICH